MALSYACCGDVNYGMVEAVGGNDVSGVVL